MLKKYYLGGFFWAPIPVKRYQNTSGFASEFFYNFEARYKADKKLEFQKISDSMEY